MKNFSNSTYQKASNQNKMLLYFTGGIYLCTGNITKILHCRFADLLAIVCRHLQHHKLFLYMISILPLCIEQHDMLNDEQPRYLTPDFELQGLLQES